MNSKNKKKTIDQYIWKLGSICNIFYPYSKDSLKDKSISHLFLRISQLKVRFLSESKSTLSSTFSSLLFALLISRLFLSCLKLYSFILIFYGLKFAPTGILLFFFQLLPYEKPYDGER